MKPIKMTIIAAATLLSVTACTATTETKVSGLITDASMNNIVIVAQSGDTLQFATESATITGDGILLGDSATVAYIGKYLPAADGKVTIATTVAVKHIARAAEGLIGAWVETVKVGDKELVQGIKLDQDGIASSVNMETLVYKNWTAKGSCIYNNADTLILSGESIGNGQSIQFCDTLLVKSIGADSLVLAKGEMMIRYAKQQ